ncbi:MAG: acyl-CoA dehydrogenase family protein [Candidatus Kapaibacterium sp.]
MLSFEYSDINQQIKDTTRKFAKEEIAPSVIERDINGEFPTEVIKKLGELGFLGLMTSPDWGGAGMDPVSYAIAIEEISAVDASIGVVLSVQNSLVDWILETFGNDQQKEKFLIPLASGEKLGAYCLSEPEAGSDARRQHTTAEDHGDHFVLNGMKNWISTGQNADIYIVFAQTDPEKEHRGIGCFAVERGTPGFEPQPKEDKMGMRSSDTCSIAIENVEVPRENMIGEIGQGFNIAMESLNGGRIGIAAQAVGIAQGAFEASVRYAQERKTFGKPIAYHQAIALKLAQMSTQIEAARLIVHKASWLKGRHESYIKAAAQAKLLASDVAMYAAREAIQIHGGYGYVREYHVERMLRDAKVTEIYEGTSEIQQIVISREVLKEFEV